MVLGRSRQIAAGRLESVVQCREIHRFGRHRDRRADRRRAQLVIVVTDSGIGIATEFLPYIFERFRQADQSITREHGGLGLGLAIAKEITELHGGVLKASSAGRGHGTRFTLMLPRLATAETALATLIAANGRTLRASGFSSWTMMPRAARSPQRHWQAPVPPSPKPAQDARRSSSGQKQFFDVLICDLAMPGMDGYELLRLIRRSPSNGHHSVAIALTALASDSDRKAVLDAGFDDHVVKPFNFPDLLRAVSRTA